jgi:hypothetical protein
MSDPITMAMVGAAIGGGGSLLKGKSLGKSLKNAAIGGTLGYGGGLAGQGLLGTGAASSAGTTASLAPEAGGGILSDIGGLSSISQGGSAMGALDSAALAEGTTGLSSSLIPTMNLANSTAAISPSMMDMLKQYGTIDNLKGAAMVADRFQPQPMQSAPSGRIEVGQAPSPEGYAKYQQAYTQLPKRREINFSLLG